jgi:hypothetical protein
MGFFDDFRKGRERAAKARPVSAEPEEQEFRAVYFSREPGMDCVDVVGESRYQSAISAITGRKGDDEVEWEGVAALLAEPDNPADENAARVIAGGRQVGYLSRRDAIRYASAIQAAARQGKIIAGDARIYAFPPERAQTPNAGVSFYLPPPDEIVADLNS